MKLSEYPIEYIQEQKVEFNKLISSDGSNKSHRVFDVITGIRVGVSDRELEKNYCEWLKKKELTDKILEKIRFAMELRKRGYELDIETQKNKEYFEGSKQAMEEFLRKLEDFLFITEYIKSKGKYMSEKEKDRWLGK